MAEVDTSAGRLSEAKTQRRPRARERVREGGFTFVVLLFLYLSFEQGRARRRHVEKKMLLGAERRWFKRGYGVTWWSLLATLRPR